MNENDIKATVRSHYGAVARGDAACLPTVKSGGCCSGVTPDAVSRAVGYSESELDEVPDGANLGLGCGNPTALASLQPGEVVVDLGSGAGFDCFLAARRVGDTGRVIGVDMTHEMLERARANAARDGVANVEFRLGEIENLPVADDTADVVISNCVINLSTDKPRVFREAFRVLKPGGRLLVSDLALRRELPEGVRRSVEMYAGCVSGAMLVDDYLGAIRAAGFADVRVLNEASYPIGSVSPDASELALLGGTGLTAEDVRSAVEAVVSVKVSATKP